MSKYVEKGGSFFQFLTFVKNVSNSHNYQKNKEKYTCLKNYMPLQVC